MSSRKLGKHELIEIIHNQSISPYSRSIYLHSYLDNADDEGIEYRVATTCIKNLIYLNAQSSTIPIVLHLHSEGGGWYDGMAIYDTICQIDAPVVIVGYGCVASMATIILQAGDLRLLMPSVDLLIHYGTLAVDNSTPAVRSEVQWNDKRDKIMLDIYAKVCEEGDYFEEKGYKEKRIKTYITTKLHHKQEWYMTAEEAVDFGLADDIIGINVTLSDVCSHNVKVKK